MALKVDRKKTYTRVVKDPDDGTKYNVELRKMDNGDTEKRSDMTTRTRVAVKKKKQQGKVPEAFMEYSFGKIRQFDLETSVVEWDFPFPKTAKDIAELDPDVANQIHDHIEELNPFIFRDVDEGQVEDKGEESDDAPSLHAVDDSAEEDDDAQEFAEDEGPTTSAAPS